MKRIALHISLLSLFCLLFAQAYAATASFDLDGNTTLESSATSTHVATGAICAPCTVTHSVSNGLATAETFTWTGPGFAGKVAGLKTTSVVFTTRLSVVEAAGNIAFAPSAVAGPASFVKPVISGFVYYAGDLIATLFRSPANIEFKSELTQLGPTSSTYVNTVTNFTASPITFDWVAGGLSGTLLGGTSVTTGTISAPFGANELIGGASFELDGDPYLMPAHAWTAAVVPVPATAWLLGSALGLLGWMRRRARQ